MKKKLFSSVNLYGSNEHIIKEKNNIKCESRHGKLSMTHTDKEMLIVSRYVICQSNYLL